LEDMTSLDMSQLSEHQRRLVVLLGTLMKNPRLVLLRNFLTVSNDEELKRLEQVLDRYKAPDTSILWSEHQLSRLPTTLDRVHLLKEGQIILSEVFAELDRMELMRLMVTPGPSLPSKIDDPELFYQLLRYNENILLDMPISILLLDRHHRVQLVNVRAKSLLGEESLLGVELSTYFEQRHPKLSQWLLEHLDLEEGGSLSSCPWTQSQTILTVSCRCFPIHDRVGRIGTMVMLDDQTDLERWRQQASTAELLHATGFMAAGVAHEINNPLEITKNYLDLLRREHSGGVSSEAIDGISEELEQIRIIVGQLVSISSHREWVPEPFCVHELIRTVFKLLAKKLLDHHFEIDLDLVPQTLEMFGSPSHMRQVLLNLVKNAIEASPKGGKISVTCRSVERQDEGWVSITLEDQGPGVPEGMEESIFMPFFSTKASNGTNMGIGLSLVKNIVHLLGGWIKAENSPTGCRFLLEFPRQGPS
jgi:C4-dicarboxylate-specific signal transduction histidine kinase